MPEWHRSTEEPTLGGRGVACGGVVVATVRSTGGDRLPTSSVKVSDDAQ